MPEQKWNNSYSQEESLQIELLGLKKSLFAVVKKIEEKHDCKIYTINSGAPQYSRAFPVTDLMDFVIVKNENNE